MGSFQRLRILIFTTVVGLRVRGNLLDIGLEELFSWTLSGILVNFLFGVP